MSRNPKLQSKNSNFKDPLTVHPWRTLLHQLSEDIDDPTAQTMIFLSKDKLMSKYTDVSQSGNIHQFINALEAEYGEEHVADYLEKLLDHMKLHGGVGEYKHADLFRKYKEEKRAYLEERNLRQDCFFSGRHETLDGIIKHLEQDGGQCKGVILCGMGGMGKTSLANEICFRLLQKRVWNITVVDQREKTKLWELMADLISQLSNCDSDLVVTETDEQNLKLQLLEVLKKLDSGSTGTLIVMDNIDGHCDNPRKLNNFCQFISDILTLIDNNSKIRLLITGRQKLCHESECMRKSNYRFGGQMLEQELTSLCVADTESILKKMADLSDKVLTPDKCTSIHELCGGNPLAIRTVAGLLKDGYSVDGIITCLEYDINNGLDVSKQVEKCLQKSLDSLNKDIQTEFVRLSVFQTAQFDLAAAVAVCCDDDEMFFGKVRDKKQKMEKDIQTGKMGTNLQTLKLHHLLEVDKLPFSRKHHKSHSGYSLHPLVWKFLCRVCKESEEFKNQKEKAQINFLKYFCTKIDECGANQDIKPIDAHIFIQNNRVHIQQFYKLIIEDGVPLRQIQTLKSRHKHKAKSTLLCKYVWKTAAIVISPNRRKLFSRKQAEIAKENKRLHDYVHWKCMEAEYFIQQDRCDQAEELMNQLDKELEVISLGSSVTSYYGVEFGCLATGWEISKEEKEPMYATYHVIQGRIKRHKKMFERSLEYLKIAEKLYNKVSFKSDLALVVNLIGCVYFQMKKYKEAAGHHEKALKIVENLVEARWHEDFSEYLTNIGSCYQQQGIELEKSKTEEKEELFKEALKKYKLSIDNDKIMKKDMLYCHACTLRNRADVYYGQRKLEKAVEDGRTVLKIMKNFFIPPNTELTIAMGTLALYYYKLGKEKKTDNEHAKAKELFHQSVTMYDDVLQHICHGGLPIDHNDSKTYRHIKDNHMKVMIELKFESRLKRDRNTIYQEFESGKYDKKIAKCRNVDIDYDAAEYFENLEGETFILESCSDDDTSESSQSTTSSSSETGSMNSDSSAIVDNHLDAAIAWRRKDSGVEDSIDDEAEDEVIGVLRLDEMEIDQQFVRHAEEKIPQGDKDSNGSHVKTSQKGQHEEVWSAGMNDSSECSHSNDFHVERRKKRRLTHQDNITESDSCKYNQDGMPGTSYIDRLSACSHDSGKGTSISSQQSRVSLRTSRFGSGTSSHGSQELGESFKSSGSQDSLTSQLRKNLKIESFEEVFVEEEEEEPLRKRTKTLDDSSRVVGDGLCPKLEQETETEDIADTSCK